METRDLADKMTDFGKKLTVGLTVPFILFFIGLVTMPFGIVFWFIGFLCFMSLFIPNHASSKTEGDTKSNA